MGNAAESRSNVDYQAFRTHFCLVSEQAAANFLPIILYRPDHVVLFVSKAMKEAADQLEDAVHTASPSTKIHRVPIEKVDDDSEVRSQVFELAFEFESSNPIVNVTGGTKLMAFGALTGAYDAGLPAFYLNVQNNVITILRGGKENRREFVAPIAVKLNLKTYLAAYGYEAGAGELPSLSYKEEQLAENLISKQSQRSVLSTLNWLAAEAQERRVLQIDPKEAKLSPDQDEALKTLCESFCDAGHLTFKGRLLSFPSEADRFFVAGGWLERYVCGQLAAMNLRPQANLVVKNKVKNEIDVAFMHEGGFCIVECKTSRLDDLEEAKAVVYKLETLKKFGGLKTTLILVSYRKLHDEAKRRADSVGIKVIHGEGLRSLKNQLRNAIAGER